MWKDDAKRKRVINIILVILIIASGIVLGRFMTDIRDQNSAYDAVLAEKRTAQQQQYAEAKQEAVEELQRAYELDLATVAQYMPGIVCWGDQLTAGSYGNVSYPDVLQKYIDAYICGVYAFSSTVDNPETYTRVDWSSYKVSIPVVNMGAGEETSGTVLGRSGAAPFTLSKELIIPETTEKTRIEFKTVNGMDSTLLFGGENGVNNVTVGGVEGKLSYSDGKYFFERTEPGTEVTVPKDTEIITAATDMYKDYIHVIWIGTYGGYSSADDLVEQVKLLLSRQTGNTDRFIVLGPCSKSKNWEANLADLDAVDSKLYHEFGNNYINLRKYFCSDGMSDAGLTMTNADKADVNIGAVPYSLRSVSGSPEFNSTAYKLIGKIVYERMDKLGFFDEIKEELNIDEVTKSLLNDNPNYFTNIVP